MNKINDLHRHNQVYNQALRAAAARVVDSGWYALGPEVDAFERAFAAYCECEFSIGVANGTEALEIALRAVGVAAGHEVITVANAGFYTSTAVLRIGAQPVYIDIDPIHLLLDPAAIKDAITPNTKAIVATHLFGLAVDMDAVLAVAKAHGLPVVEDCAQAHGARWNGKCVGGLADIAAFSFFPTKNLGALGDGGAITTNSPVLVERVKKLRQYGWDKKYYVAHAGASNSRLDEIQAAMLSVKLPHLDQMNQRRRDIAARYCAGLDKRLTLPKVLDERYVAHLFVLRTPLRDKLQAYLQANNIGTDIHYPVLDCDQDVWQGARPAEVLSVSREAVKQILTLPCFPEMTDAEVDHVIDVVNQGVAAISVNVVEDAVCTP